MIGFIISVFKLFLSGVLGGVIGYERKQRTAVGFRMLILVAVGATAFALASLHIGNISAAADPGLIVAMTVVAVGVLGAAVIIADHDKRNALRTTISIWSAGAVGILVGVGLIIESIILTGLVYYVLSYLPDIFEEEVLTQNPDDAEDQE